MLGAHGTPSNDSVSFSTLGAIPAPTVQCPMRPCVGRRFRLAWPLRIFIGLVLGGYRTPVDRDVRSLTCVLTKRVKLTRVDRQV